MEMLMLVMVVDLEVFGVIKSVIGEFERTL